MMASPIPDGFHTVAPHLTIKGAGDAIEFYKKAFGAEETARMVAPDGSTVMYAEIRIGDSPVMISDEMPQGCCKSPGSVGATTAVIHLYVADCDQAYQQATDAGAEVVMPLMDAFWGDRYGMVKDPFGHCWSIATHKEDLTPEQIGQRAQQFFANMGEHCGG